MRKMLNLISVLSICVLAATYTQAESSNEPDGKVDTSVKIVLNKFEVTDTNLELSWKIVNNTDHEIWICQSLHPTPESSVFEKYLDKDNKTLVMSRRFFVTVSENLLYKFPPIRSRYVRLSPGQEKVESVLYELSIQPNPFSTAAHESVTIASAKFAERLSLEIGYFDENLPEMILKIVELADHFECNLGNGLPNPGDPKDSEIDIRFFGGRGIAGAFQRATGWADEITSGDEEISMFYFGPHMGEKILRLTVDDVYIPYKI